MQTELKIIWIVMAAFALSAAVVLQVALPRYEFQIIDNGRAMMIHDRWAGRFQRANYDANGEPSLTRVLTPF